jgi:hypothetical protein
VTDLDRWRDVARGQWWTQLIATSAVLLADRLAMIRAAVDLDEPSRRTAATVESLLEAARAALRRRGGLRGLLDRLSGRSEVAFMHLHAAETLLVDLLPDADVDAMIPTASARLGRFLPATDLRRSLLAWQLRSPRPEVRRAALRSALEVGYAASDQKHARVRVFRNTVVLATVVLTLVMIAFVSFAAWKPHLLPLCFQPAIPTPSGGAQTADVLVCPSGITARPAPVDALIVTLFGAMGGAISAVLAIRNVRGTSTPYAVPLALVALKVATGAAAAVLGLLLLRGEFVPGFAQLETPGQILAYAFVFGFAQQLFTRLIDFQARTLLSDVPIPRLPSDQPEMEPPPPEPVAGDIRKALHESLQASMSKNTSHLARRWPPINGKDEARS